MSATPEQAAHVAATVEELVANLESAIIGKAEVLRLVVTCLLTEGHLLLEDLPGTGKTSLAKALARSVGGQQQRIQFTPDLLPSDVTGSSVLDPETGRFVFVPGPVFAGVVLADEINRASPKTQSALLEVMEEGQVTVDGTAHRVPAPFMVIATQNPVELAGTYRLPEAQLDRFLLRTSLGYPNRLAMIEILAGSADRTPGDRVRELLHPRQVAELARTAASAHVEQSILGYISDLVDATRQHRMARIGVSVRGALALVRTARTWAMAAGRSFVTADDVKAVAAPVLGHRIVLHPEHEFTGATSDQLVREVLAEVPPPTERVRT